MNEQHQPAFFADAAPPPDLGARLSRFIVRRALGARSPTIFADERTPGRPAPGCVPAPTR